MTNIPEKINRCYEKEADRKRAIKQLALKGFNRFTYFSTERFRFGLTYWIDDSIKDGHIID